MPDHLIELSRLVGDLTAEVRGLRRDVQEDRAASASYRSSMRDEIGKLVMRTTQLESDVGSMKARVEATERVTVEVTTLRTKAEGAGTLGRWLLKAGGWVLAAAGGWAAAWTMLTGRPPP